MNATNDCLIVRLAQSQDDILAAQRLRYRVFVQEMGGTGPMVDHQLQLEADKFDPYFDHLLLIDPRQDEPNHVVGVYRLLTCEAAKQAGGFYSAAEYDLTPLVQSGRKLLELGRSCLDKSYRGGTGMYYLWNGLAAYVAEHGIEVLFGTASFHGTDIAALAPSLSLLHHKHLAPAPLRVRSREFQTMDLLPVDQIDRIAAMRNTPALIKAYLKIGGTVGEGAYVDHAFNTTDVCLILDTQRMNAAQTALYTGQVRR